MRSPLLPTLLALSWPLAAGAVDAPAGIYFQHHDWVVACDNTRTCRAAGYQADDYDAEVSPPPVSLLLTREAGAGQPVSAQLTVDPGEDGRMPSALSLRIDDRDLGDLALDRDKAVATLSRAQVEALLSVLRRKAVSPPLATTGAAGCCPMPAPLRCC